MFQQAIQSLEAEIEKLKPVAEPEKKGFSGFISKATSAAKDALSANFDVHFRELPSSRSKEITKTHGEVSGNFLACIDLDRVGSEDASILITDQWLSFRSESGLISGTNLTLKVHWSWFSEVHKKDDLLAFRFREPAQAPPLCIPWPPFFDDRVAEMNALVTFLQTILSHSLSGGPEHSYKLLNQLRNIESGSQAGLDLLKDAQISVDVMFGRGIEKSNLKDVRTLLESDLILEKCRLSPPSRELYHDIVTTIRVLEEEKNKASGYADQHQIQDNLDMLQQRMSDTVKGLDGTQRPSMFVAQDLPTQTPQAFLGCRREWLHHISFPQGHPKEHQMYIVHPMDDSNYLPLGEFDALLTEEKRHEFFSLVRALGAKKIKYRNLVRHQQSQSEKNQSTRSNKLSGSPMGIGGTGSTGASMNSGTLDSSNTSSESDLFVESEYAPSGSPKVPDNLKWFNQELNWQRLAEDRIQAGLRSTKLILKTNRREYFSRKEEESVQTELSAVYNGVKVTNISGFASSKELKQETTEEQAIEIHIEFE